MEVRKFRGARAVGFSLVVGCAIQLSACAGDTELPAPPEGCRDFIDAFCSRLAECELPSERARTYQDCTFGFQLSIECERVVKLSASYENCIDAIGSASCQRIQGELPASCKAVLLHD